jgi:fatty-acid desaturase
LPSAPAYEHPARIGYRDLHRACQRALSRGAVDQREVDVLAFFLVVLLAAVVLGFLGVVLKGLFWLLVIGIIIFVVNLLFGGWGIRRHTDRRRRVR